MPSLVGKYVYGDYQSGNIWALTEQGGRMVSNQVIASLTAISSFGEDQAGELYVLAFDTGFVYRLREDGGGGPRLPARLSETGIFSHTASLSWVEGLIPYQVNHGFWSDNAHKVRFLALPDGGTIGFHPTDAWTLPVGSVLIKHFELEMSLGDPSTRRRIETRVLVNHRDGWAGYTYRWNDQQTDGDLLATGQTTTYTIRDPSQGLRQQVWSFPSRTDCLQCHTAPAGRVLGFNTLQTNLRLPVGPSRWENQLDIWNRMQLFSSPIQGSSSYAALRSIQDHGASLDERARSYLHANCANCHLPGGAMNGAIDMRYLTPRNAMGLLWVRPTRGDLGLPDAYRIKPGDHGSSVLWHRLCLLDSRRMPPLSSNLLDLAGHILIAVWIDWL
jgi:uncharacterized repeat protein (TIGR03806 family)